MVSRTIYNLLNIIHCKCLQSLTPACLSSPIAWSPSLPHAHMPVVWSGSHFLKYAMGLGASRPNQQTALLTRTALLRPFTWWSPNFHSKFSFKVTSSGQLFLIPFSTLAWIKCHRYMHHKFPVLAAPKAVISSCCNYFCTSLLDDGIVEERGASSPL